ncbi:MAG: hypothetical protein ACRDRY_24095 [Pseudonocardiaceae bacterium]
MSDLPARVDAMTDEVSGLKDAVLQLASRTAVTETKAGRSWNWLKGVVPIVAFDLLVAVGMLGGFLVQQDTNHRLERAINNQCAQLALFLGSYRPESRPPESRDEYERVFDNLRSQFRDLECDPATIVPPATTPPR